jgi:cytochrome c-type biogenesis protein CcmH/NrfG
VQQKQKISLLNEPTQTYGVNPNSVAVQSFEKEKQRQNQLELSKIEAQAKVQIAQIESQNKEKIAKINAQAQQKIAEADVQVQLAKTQLEAKTSKETREYFIYGGIVAVLIILLAIYLFVKNAQKNREHQRQLHEDKLRHEQFLKEKELEQERMHKILELASDGKLPESVGAEILLTLAKPESKLIN